MRDPVTKQTNKQTTATKSKASKQQENHNRIPDSLKSENKTKPKGIKLWLPTHEENEDKAVACRAP